MSQTKDMGFSFMPERVNPISQDHLSLNPDLSPTADLCQKDLNRMEKMTGFVRSSPEFIVPSKNSGLNEIACGIGLKPDFFEGIIEATYAEDFPLDFVEIHSENYMADGGILLYNLDKVAERHAISMHGVGMSLCSTGGLNVEHLAKTKRLMQRVRPAIISEHLALSVINGVYMNDLLPVPYVEEMLELVIGNINQMQDFLGCQISIENPSSYLEFKDNKFREDEFLNEITAATGCGLVLDVNNIYVSAWNHGWSAVEYINNINANTINEYHLAGHCDKEFSGRIIKLDDHGSNVSGEVWELFKHTVETLGPKPCLIEWDTNIPSLFTLLQEANRARHYMTEGVKLRNQSLKAGREI